MKLNRTKKVVVATAAAFLVAPLIGSTAYAAKNDYGVDWSRYQGNLGKFGYAKDRFSICQLGGYYNGQFVVQSTYATQVQYTIAQGKRAHTYLYSQFRNNAEADQMLNYYLPKVQTPKGSIVALDVESGTPSTSSIIYAMNRIKAAGYTPILYSGDSFIKAHVNYKAVLQQFPNSLWIARYPDYQVRSTERTQSLPVIDGMAIVQFTSTYVAGGLDGNKDYLGVTDNGYNGTTTSKQGGTAVKTDSTTTAIKAGQQANNTPKSDIKVGDTVKVNYSANKWASGQSIPSWVKGNSYKVSAISGNKLLLSGINSWLNKSDAEILSVGTPVTISTVNTGAKLVVDGKLGHNTILKGQKLYNMRYQDGVISRPSSYVRILQKHLGVTRDGILGPQTIRAMQRKLGVHVDGILGPQTIKAWQQSINAGIRF